MNKYFFIIVFPLIVSNHAFSEQLEGEAESRTGAVMRAMAIGTTYGVLAGAFLGLASIAFVQHPSKNLKNIAVGSSLGLYAGILFGGYLSWSTFSDERGSDLPTEEDYDSLDYESFIPQDLPKIHETKYLSSAFNFNEKLVDTWSVNVPVFHLKF